MSEPAKIEALFRSEVLLKINLNKVSPEASIRTLFYPSLATNHFTNGSGILQDEYKRFGQSFFCGVSNEMGTFAVFACIKVDVMFSSEGVKVEDQFLIRQVLEGNTNAFRFLVLRYQKPIFRYLRSFGLPEPQIEEIAQDVFIKAYAALSDYDANKSQFNTWLFVIAKNRALNLISRHSYTKETLTENEPEMIQHETPLTALEKSVVKKNLNNSINQLPVQFKNVITLFHFNEMSLEEISAIEQCNIGTVKSRLHRAKSMLKEIILKNYGTESL